LRRLLWPSWHPLLVLLLFVGGTWIFWLPAAALLRSEPGLARTWHYAGGAMPLLMTLVCQSQLPRDARSRFWQQLVDHRRMAVSDWALALLLPVGLTAVAILIDRMLGGPGATPELASLARQPLRLLGSALFLLIFGPIPEELAWRGYLLDPLESRMGRTAANVTLGLVWLLWHLPLFGIEGSYQAGLGWGTTSFWLYMLDKVPLTIILAWVYWRAEHSTLAAVLLHWSVNLTGEMVALSQRSEMILIASYWLLAAWIVRAWTRARS